MLQSVFCILTSHTLCVQLSHHPALISPTLIPAKVCDHYRSPPSATPYFQNRRSTTPPLPRTLFNEPLFRINITMSDVFSVKVRCYGKAELLITHLQMVKTTEKIICLNASFHLEVVSSSFLVSRATSNPHDFYLTL